jgi:ABC-type glycerol-3-phosphate transport system permease component
MEKSFKELRLLQGKKGIALVLAMFVLVLIAILLVAFLELITSDLQITTNHAGRLKALYIADAGIEYAVAQLRTNSYWTVTQGQTIFPSGSGNSYTVTYPKTGTTRVIRSVGMIADKFTAIIEAKVSIRGASSPYNIKIVSWQEKDA